MFYCQVVLFWDICIRAALKVELCAQFGKLDRRLLDGDMNGAIEINNDYCLSILGKYGALSTYFLFITITTEPYTVSCLFEEGHYSLNCWAASGSVKTSHFTDSGVNMYS